MSKISHGAHIACDQIKCFFRQTFRRHTGAEYSEFLTRGVEKDSRFNRQYPWVYIRVFAAIFIIFAVYLLVIRFTSNELFAPTVMLMGAIVFNIPFMTLLYEIYPRRDLSLIAVFVAMLIGGTCANVIVQMLFSFVKVSDEWLFAVEVGFFEELSKALVVIVIIAAVKTRQPLVGFLMGAAVGCGFSVVEDFGYIFVSAAQVSNINLSSAIAIFFSRGLSSFCTHTVWTAMIGWAYVFYPHRFTSFGFYFCLILNCALHVVWDLPLGGTWYFVAISVSVVIAATEGIAVLYIGRKRIFEKGGEELTPDFFREDELSCDKRTPEYYMHKGHLSLTIAAFLMAVVAVVYCSVPFRETVYTAHLGSADELVAFMQTDISLEADGNRAFDRSDDAVNTVVKENDVVVRVTQKEKGENALFYYVYNVSKDKYGNINYLLTEIYAELQINGGSFKYLREDLYSEGRLYASFFRIRTDVIGIYVTSDGGASVLVSDDNFVRDLSQPQYAILFYVFAGLGGGAIVIYIVYYIKSRRLKNVE